jgi:hypothetical protein
MQLQSVGRVPAIGLGLIAVLGVAACGSSTTAIQTTCRAAKCDPNMSGPSEATWRW